MYARILVPIDGSETARAACRHAIALAAEQAARLRFVYVVDETLGDWDIHGWIGIEKIRESVHTTGQNLLDEARAMAQQAGVEADAVLLETAGRHIGQAIDEAASLWPADLIVIGTHGRRGLDRLMIGSVAETTVRLSRVPVLTIPKARKGAP
jgi:nucleotide-binding universal stress UspA family protein